MKLAINYSLEIAGLLRAGEVAVDLLKCPDWDDLVRDASELAPVYVHFPFAAGPGRLHQVDWARVRDFLAGTDTDHVSFHLRVTAEELPDVPLGACSAAQRRRVADAVLRDLDRAATQVGSERIAVENLIYRGHHGDVLRCAVHPETVATVVRESGCGLVLDLSHAFISAHYLGVHHPLDLWEYLDAFPTDRLRELHLTGLALAGHQITDHMPFSGDDWSLAQTALDRIASGRWATPAIVAWEYGGVGPVFSWRSDRAVIAAQLPRLHALVRNAAVSARAPRDRPDTSLA